MTIQDRLYPVPGHFSSRANLSPEAYKKMYAASVNDPDTFWRAQGKRLDWAKPYTRIRDVAFGAGDTHIRWFEDGMLNVAYNCIDRHLKTRGDKIALLWEGDDPGQSQAITYKQLHVAVCKFANVLKNMGVSSGDRVTIYMPMILEAAYAMLACARIGAVHSVVFGGFSPEALAGRITDCDSRFLITADEGIRGGRVVPLKANADKAAILAGGLVEKMLVIRRTGKDVGMVSDRDIWLHEAEIAVSADCPAEPVSAEHPLFILYTSGSTGKPKGVLHTSGGYLVWASMTHEYVFDIREDDIFWCTADVGWITGHTYILYGPLANGATSVMFEGVPTWPDASRLWQVCDKHGVTVFYTAPTAIRALMREGDEPVQATGRTTLRLLGTVGEPINPEAWKWYYHIVGDGRCPIVDTYWQTETGGVIMVPLPGATDMKPGAASHPFFGIKPELVNADGQYLQGAGAGNLVITDSWPGQMRTVYGNHQRFIDTYFSTWPGVYVTGDGCKRDRDGFYWITGRVDDVINVSGHRLGTAEVESALVSHADVSEAAVVGYPHAVKGQGIYAYVTLRAGLAASDTLLQALKDHVRAVIGPIASPDRIQCAPGLPKTRSGKIMRRILRKIAADDFADLGDISTLAEPEVVAALIANRQNRQDKVHR